MTEEKPPALPDSDEALRARIVDLERDVAANRSEIAVLKAALEEEPDDDAPPEPEEDDDDVSAYA